MIRIWAASSGRRSSRIEPSSQPRRIPVATVAHHSSETRRTSSRSAGSKTAEALTSPQTTAFSRTARSSSSSARSAVRTAVEAVLAGGLAPERRRRCLLGGVLERRANQARAAGEVVVEKRGRHTGLRGDLLDAKARARLAWRSGARRRPGSPRVDRAASPARPADPPPSRSSRQSTRQGSAKRGAGLRSALHLLKW